MQEELLRCPLILHFITIILEQSARILKQKVTQFFSTSFYFKKSLLENAKPLAAGK